MLKLQKQTFAYRTSACSSRTVFLPPYLLLAKLKISLSEQLGEVHAVADNEAKGL